MESMETYNCPPCLRLPTLSTTSESSLGANYSRVAGAMGAFVFCPGDCLFESEPSPTSKCSTRGGSWGMYTTFASTKKQIRQNPLWLWNPEEMTPEIQNRGTSGPQKGHVFAKNFFKKVSVQESWTFSSLEILITIQLYQFSEHNSSLLKNGLKI